jgi:hypothetical protein
MTLKISKGLRLHQPSVPHITGTGEQRHMGRSGDWYENGHSRVQLERGC